MPDLDWVTIAERRRTEVETLTEQVEALQAENRRLKDALAELAKKALAVADWLER